MEQNFALGFLSAQTQMLVEMQTQQAMEELGVCNATSRRFGLAISETQLRALVDKRFEALQNTGRVEFGPGVLPKLVEAFCDSRYVSQADYTDTLAELQEMFYYFKSEAAGKISDDELIAFMRTVFDGKAQGSLAYLANTSLDALCRAVRAGVAVQKADTSTYDSEEYRAAFGAGHDA